MTNRYQGLTEAAKARLAGREAIAAKAAGVLACTIYKWRSGVTTPSYEHAAAVVGALDGVALEDFGFTARPDGRVARLLALPHKPAPVAFVRAGGGALCGTCHRAYARHPVDPRPMGDLVLHVLCDGRRVKL